MKATLQFDLDDFDDREAHMRCIKSLSLCMVVWQLDNELRLKIKHPSEYTPREYLDGLEDARKMLRNLMEEYNIDLSELMS